MLGCIHSYHGPIAVAILGHILQIKITEVSFVVDASEL